MKLRKILTLSAPLTMLLAASPIVLTACNTNKTPIVYKAESKVVPYYGIAQGIFPPYTAEYILQSITQKVTHFNDSPIPYIDLDEAFNSETPYYARTAHGVTIITNYYNMEWIKIDYANQTIQFSDWDKSIDLNPNSYGPLTEGCGGGNKYYYSVKQTKYFAGKTQTLDLSYYGLKAYLYKENYSGAEEHGFIPYHLLKNLLNISLVSKPCDYNGVGFFQIMPGNSANAVKLMKEVKDSATIYNSEYMEYCYNMIALTLDCRFGLLERESRVTKGKTIEYMPNGAYAMLAPYHDRLVSMEPNVSAEAMREIFTTKLDDGGHARYVHLNAFSTETYADGAEKGTETQHTFDIFKKLGAERKKTDYDITNKHGATATGDFMTFAKSTDPNADKIAYITFDSFQHESLTGVNEKEKAAGRALPASNGGTVSEDNYYQDTMRLTMYANDQIRNDPTIKNVVVDISNNGGGTVYTEHFIASWLCGGVTEKIYNPTTGAYCEYEVKADINGDGKFDDYDTIANYNLYLITSSGSFSCGNMLPCNIADNRDMSTTASPKTVIMGNKSGGGACFVDDEIFLGPQSYTRSSSTFHMLRGASTNNNKITVDTGAEVTKGWEIDDWNKPEDFYKRDVINGWIWNGK